jgi:hypothetical protein
LPGVTPGLKMLQVSGVTALRLQPDAKPEMPQTSSIVVEEYESLSDWNGSWNS